MHVVHNEPYIPPMQPIFIVWYLCMHTKSLRPGMNFYWHGFLLWSVGGNDSSTPELQRLYRYSLAMYK